jgi:hypothetical protein
VNEPGDVWQWLIKLINLSACFWFNFASCTSSAKSKSSLDKNGSHGSSSGRIVGSGWLFKVSLNSSALTTRVRLPLWGWYSMAISPSCGACVSEPISVPVSRSIFQRSYCPMLTTCFRSLCSSNSYIRIPCDLVNLAPVSISHILVD